MAESSRPLTVNMQAYARNANDCLWPKADIRTESKWVFLNVRFGEKSGHSTLSLPHFSSAVRGDGGTQRETPPRGRDLQQERTDCLHNMTYQAALIDGFLVDPDEISVQQVGDNLVVNSSYSGITVMRSATKGTGGNGTINAFSIKVRISTVAVPVIVSSSSWTVIRT